MRISRVVEEYVALKHSLGMNYKTQANILKAFCRAAEPVNVGDVTPASVLGFLSPKGTVTTSWHFKCSALRGLFDFAIRRGYAASRPLPLVIPKRPPYARPHIYTPEELQRILSAAKILEGRNNGGLWPLAFQTLILLLYGTGLRISEALALTLEDADLSKGLLTIRKAKFDKPRLVPIGPRLTDKLRAYVEERPSLSRRPIQSSALFITCMGALLPRQTAERDFRIVRAHADVRRNDGAYYQPRLHDLRHTFAVHRLTAWYRSGANVQQLLPQLSTYLGHVGIAETAYYLTMTPELLDEANRRFERYAFPEVSHD